MKLTRYKLGEILNVTRGASLSGEFYATEGEYIRLTCGNFDYQNNCFKENKSKDNLYYVGDFRSEFLMEEGDIITPLTEQAIGLLGSTAIIPESGKYIQSQDVAKIVCKEDLLDKNFAFYLISSALVKQQLSAAAQQTKIRHTSPDKIKDCTVWIPELSEQKRIGKLLRSIDSKIELNRQINQNLEAMAKQLYDYWFVQFDFPNEEGKPYKSSGGKMVWNEKLKREIPEGWNISLIKDIATTYSGGTPKSTNIEYYDNGEIAWINSGELNSPIITKTTNYITKCGLENSSAKLYPSNSILVAMYGATAGKVSLLTFEACSNQAVCGVIPTIENMLYYVYFHISSLYSHFITLSTGSARDNISQDTIKNILLPIPTRNILKLFDEKIGSIYQTIVNNYQQIDSLTKQRDELLPLLMNGQVSVNSDLSAHRV
ncbi:restriction endonuclease subunit S [Bacteroides thetaiotaomicron]|uniref:restriction endonuclease subunit S n=1 Tax=Bacteroides thetaiotaomicron TaxID=818 RepID=UPI00232D13C8|nr:restriction endonuclease subunit S [Bacteroides thetaiotaomicron]MDC2206067.1 restriction endonuclease subunit S [Bacteroides thetaiotaomicron]MDC2211029.1 restriction endonuclease subunit S [Bacteroides thetaiotaomicron]